MKLCSVEALVIRIPRPGCGELSWFRARERCPAISSETLATLLTRVTTDSGVTGWGEAQALAAPEVAGCIVQTILKPALEGQPFEGTGLEIEALWDEMYNRMRVCGQTGGFMLDAMAAIDIALWDLAGKIHGASIASLIAGANAKAELETYVNYLPGEAPADRLECARGYYEAGCRRFKIFHHASEGDLLREYDALADLCGAENVAVDAQWRLAPSTAPALGAEIDQRGAMWLECPFAPESPAAHAKLAAAIRTPIALGESYRTHFEMAPFFRARAMRIVQPGLGRCGITEALRIARTAERKGLEVSPYLPPAMGPLLFATLQFAAAVPNCRLSPYTPGLVKTANEFSVSPIAFRDGRYKVPTAPGLGTELVEPEVRLLGAA